MKMVSSGNSMGIGPGLGSSEQYGTLPMVSVPMDYARGTCWRALRLAPRGDRRFLPWIVPCYSASESFMLCSPFRLPVTSTLFSPVMKSGVVVTRGE